MYIQTYARIVNDYEEVKVKGKRSHTADTSAFGRRTLSSNCSVSWLRYNQGATPGGFTFPTRNSWYPLYRPRRDARLGEPRPGLELTTTKSSVRPLLGSNPQPRDPESNALRLTRLTQTCLFLRIVSKGSRISSFLVVYR